ncbi:MAG: YggT family protein [Acetobacteraceae bacterium]|nr:YggT family protein [Acetobacteraceae bacterium]MSP30863.1 YggT family protein [Acetobacteraceae bacterium]
MTILFDLLHLLISLMKIVLIVHIIYSWLVTFNILDTRNRIVWNIGDFLFRVTEPVLRPIRRYMPNLGPVDLSPLVVFIALWLVDQILFRLQMTIALGSLAPLLL